MDPEKNIPDTLTPNTDLPSEAEVVEPKNLFQVPDHLSEPVSATPSVNMGSINVDPKLLASNLEDKRSDDISSEGPIFHQPLQSQQPQVQQSDSVEETLPVQPEVQIVEKIVYQKQRVHGFFRTLTLITLLFTGVLMLLEGLGISFLNIDTITMNIFYPVFVILSVIVIWSYKGIFGKIFGLLMFLSVVAGFFILGVYSSLTPSTINATGSTASIDLVSGSTYSKLYLSTLINALDVNAQTGSTLLSSQYNTERPLSIKTGHIQSGHDYAIISESNKINLLERVYTHLDIGLTKQEPIYLYNKTLLGQNNIDLTNVDVRGVRLHGAVVSWNLVLGSSLLDTGSIQSSGTVAQGLSGAVALSGTNISSGTTDTGVQMTGIIAKTPGISQIPTIDLDLQAAIADVTLHLPKDMGVRIYYKSYIGKTDFPGFIEKENNIYESVNIDKATSVVDINAVFGLSRFTILQDR